MYAMGQCRIILALLVIAPYGCSRVHSPRTQASPREYRYNDPRLSPDERLAVRSAAEALYGPNRPLRIYDRAHRYWVSKHNGEWFVTVWHVQGFKWGKPQFAPGGHTDVLLDQHFNVKWTMPGE